MTTATRTTLEVRIIGQHLPGRRWSCYDSIHVGVQRKAEVVGPVPGDAGQALFDLKMDVVTDETGLDFRGPFVQGKRGERGSPLCAAVRPPRVQWRVSPPRRSHPELAADQPGSGR
jgi:Family of unknown function (DUF5990)